VEVMINVNQKLIGFPHNLRAPPLSSLVNIFIFFFHISTCMIEEIN